MVPKRNRGELEGREELRKRGSRRLMETQKQRERNSKDILTEI